MQYSKELVRQVLEEKETPNPKVTAAGNGYRPELGSRWEGFGLLE